MLAVAVLAGLVGVAHGAASEALCEESQLTASEKGRAALFGILNVLTAIAAGFAAGHIVGGAA